MLWKPLPLNATPTVANTFLETAPHDGQHSSPVRLIDRVTSNTELHSVQRKSYLGIGKLAPFRTSRTTHAKTTSSIRTRHELRIPSYTLGDMNTTHDLIPLFGDDEFESASESSASAETPPETDPNPPPSDDVAGEASDAAEPSPTLPVVQPDPSGATPAQAAVADQQDAQAPADVQGQASRVGSGAEVDAWLAQGPDSGRPPTSAWIPTDEAADAAMAAWIADFIDDTS